MVNIENNKITLTKGDSVNIRLTTETLDGIEYKIKDTDTVKLIVRKSSSANNNLVEKDIYDNCFIITPADTANLPAGIYFYQVEIVTAEGEHHTVIPFSQFRLTGGF